MQLPNEFNAIDTATVTDRKGSEHRESTDRVELAISTARCRRIERRLD